MFLLRSARGGIDGLLVISHEPLFGAACRAKRCSVAKGLDGARTVEYIIQMVEVRESSQFTRWIASLRDIRAAARIDARIGRLRLGNFGDVKSVGGDVSELRIDYGTGYRVYFTRQGALLVILLCGGDKGSQARDIDLAKRLARALME
jgi:putative addiction module killer protein